jgi:hypothetical protein
MFGYFLSALDDWLIEYILGSKIVGDACIYMSKCLKDGYY